MIINLNTMQNRLKGKFPEILIWGLVIGVCLFALVFFVGLASISIDHYPTCIQFKNEEDVSQNKLLLSIDTWLTNQGFRKNFVSNDIWRWENKKSSIEYAKGAGALISICTKDESANDWLTVTKQIESYLPQTWYAYVQRNPQRYKCPNESAVVLDRPIDFDRLIKSGYCDAHLIVKKKE